MADQATNVILTILRYIVDTLRLKRVFCGPAPGVRDCAPLLIDRPLYRAYNVQIHDASVVVG